LFSRLVYGCILGNKVNLSTEYEAHHLGEKAIDGLYMPSQHGISEHASIAHTKRELSPWIQVDLDTDHFVYGVKIWNRCEESTSGL